MIGDSLEVLGGNLWDADSSGLEVLILKLRESVLVKLGFQLLQEFCEFYVEENKLD